MEIKLSCWVIKAHGGVAVQLHVFLALCSLNLVPIKYINSGHAWNRTDCVWAANKDRFTLCREVAADCCSSCLSQRTYKDTRWTKHRLLKCHGSWYRSRANRCALQGQQRHQNGGGVELHDPAIQSLYQLSYRRYYGLVTAVRRMT